MHVFNICICCVKERLRGVRTNATEWFLPLKSQCVCVCALSDDEHVAQGADRHGWCGIHFTNTHRHTHSISLLNMLPLHLHPAIPQGEYPLLSVCACSFVCICLVGGPVLDPLKFVHGISVKLPIPTHISHGHHETNVAVEQGSGSVPESVKGFAV